MTDIPPPPSGIMALLLLLLSALAIVRSAATQRQAAAVVCSRPNIMVAFRKALEEAGVIFTEPTKTRGPGECLKG